MMLNHTIASYTAASRRAMEQVLTDEVKSIIARVAKERGFAKEVEPALLADLVDMDIFYQSEGSYKPNTAIFFKEDIELITEPVLLMSDDMSVILRETAEGFLPSSPNTRNFICAVVGMGQGLHTALKSIGCASEWQRKTGKYEKSRVDFNEECPAYHQFGKDLQNKNVVKGEMYTSVTIGHEFNDFHRCFSTAGNASPGSNPAFMKLISKGLIDLFPQLILGHAKSDALRQAARTVNVDCGDILSVITAEQAAGYQPYIDKISAECNNYYIGKLGYIKDVLLSTTPGKGGAPFQNLMMNFWRYMRKGIAAKLYESGFLTDDVPTDGSYTVFYESSIGYFD